MALMSGEERGPKALRPISAYDRIRGSARTICARIFALKPRAQPLETTATAREMNARVARNVAVSNDKDGATNPTGVGEC